MNDRTLPWLIVPRRTGGKEVRDLSRKDSEVLTEEMALASKGIVSLCSPDKPLIDRAIGHGID